MLRYTARRAALYLEGLAVSPSTSANRSSLQHSYRNLVTSSSSSTPPSGPNGEGSSSSSPPDASKEDDLFSEENIKDIHPLDVEKLKVTYGLIKEHVDAVEKGIEEIDPASNPLLDPRSFELRRLPKLPKEILSHFRTELPAEVAESSKPVNTRDIWDSLSSGEPNELLTESASPGVEWERIDQLTMTKQSLFKRGRSNNAHTSTTTSAPATAAARTMAPPPKKKKPIKLKNERGKIEVDFRAVATLNMFITETGKIMPRRKTKLSAKSQKLVSKAIKRARCMALIDPAPTGPSMAELAAMHSPEELDVPLFKIDSFTGKNK